MFSQGNSARSSQLRGDRRDFVAREFAHHVADRQVLLGEIERIVHVQR